jgi:maleate isomerase
MSADRRKDGFRFGLLVPSSSTTQEREFTRVLPDGVSLHVARMTLKNIDAASTLRIAEEIEAESRKLADADIDVIALAATAPSSRNGMGYDKQLQERMAKASGTKATTASTALVEALELLGAKKIVIGAPWSPAVNETVAAFMEANGFSVLQHKAMGIVSNHEVGLLEDDTAYDMGCSVDRKDADAVVLACGNWRTLRAIDRLEDRLGKPVLSTNQVTLWGALRMIAAVPSLPGAGSILRDHLS